MKFVLGFIYYFVYHVTSAPLIALQFAKACSLYNQYPWNVQIQESSEIDFE